MNGIGKLPDKSVEEHDAPNKIHDTAATNVIIRFILQQSMPPDFHVNF